MKSIFSCGPPESVKIDSARKKKKSEYVSEFEYLASTLEKKIIILKLHTSNIMNRIIKKAL